MKRVKVNAYQVGLVFKNEVYKEVLKEGVYWFWKNELVFIVDIYKPFHPPVELNILLQDPVLADMLIVVDVKDNEIVLKYENGLLKEVLAAGRYAFWKSAINYEFVRADISNMNIDAAIPRSVITNKLVMPYIRTYEVQNHEVGLLFVDGQYTGKLMPGIYYWWKNAVVLQVLKADIRQKQLELNGQEILTKDKAALRINAWAEYKIVDVEKALIENAAYERQLYVTIQLALREYVAGYGFDELLEKKDNISPVIVQQVKATADQLGLVLVNFGIRDIILPGDMKEIMNQVLVAEKKAQANTIMRREETASTRSLLNTAKLMEENAMLWKLKEMEYVEKIAEKINSISVSGNGMLVEQLKDIFISKK